MKSMALSVQLSLTSHCPYTIWTVIKDLGQEAGEVAQEPEFDPQNLCCLFVCLFKTFFKGSWKDDLLGKEVVCRHEYMNSNLPNLHKARHSVMSVTLMHL